MVAPLDKKLLRNLRSHAGQVITIALVVACGVAGYATMRSTWTSLQNSRDTYYERYRFADVFANLKRAPESVAGQIEGIEGVAALQTRVVDQVTMPLEGMREPAHGRVISLPESGEPSMNALALTEGRTPEPGHADEVVVLEAFAGAHDLHPGDALPAVINGTLRELRIVGVAMSPEYVFAITGVELSPDDKKFGVLWMNRDALSAAFDMDGAFNDVSIRLQPGASPDAVVDDVDRILDRYGSLGAVGRDRQMSNFFIEQEMAQLEMQATLLPSIFLAVAAFLVNVVLSRMVQLQRPQIAALKALGYADRSIAGHYLKLVSFIVLIGCVLGIALGAWGGREMTELYTDYFRFPTLRYELDVQVATTGALVSLVAAVVGAMTTMKSVVSLPPAEAMRPPPPASYKPLLIDRIGMGHWITQSTRMVFREIQRRPTRMILSILGISAAVGILVLARFFADVMVFLIDDYMPVIQREDIAVAFLLPQPERARRELEQLPGVEHAEAQRMVPVRFRNGPISRESSIIGYPEVSEFRRMVDEDFRIFEAPEQGMILTSALAEILHVRVGETLRVEVLEGNRQEVEIPVVGVINEMFGIFGHMRNDELSRVLGEEPAVSLVTMRVDEQYQDELYARLRDFPAVASISNKADTIQRFREQSGNTTAVMSLILTIFASTIAIGVVYNNARISLSTRSRDLASLRVLGFTKREIGKILLGEIWIQTLLAIPPGLYFGQLIVEALLGAAYQEAWRMPAILSSRTLAFAAVVTIAASIFSALLVRRKLDNLDLIGVLKTRE